MSKYNETGPYQSMSGSQKSLMDHIENNSFYKRNAREDIVRWKEKRANMTEKELEEMKQKDELDKWTGKWMLIGLGAVLFIACALLIIGEMTGNPLVT